MKVPGKTRELVRLFELRKTATVLCARCRRAVQTSFEMSGPTTLCFRCALRHPPLVRRAALTALVVGSILTTINQLDVLLSAPSARVFAKVGLTYLVPYCVTAWGALSNAARRPSA
jgi:hypothetical protein